MTLKLTTYCDEASQMLVSYLESDDSVENCIFSFYFYWNKIRILTRGYVDNSVAVFEMPKTGGVFSVSVFIKHIQTGEIRRLNSVATERKATSNILKSKLPEKLFFADRYLKPIDQICIEQLTKKLLDGIKLRADVVVHNVTFPVYAKPSNEKRLFILLNGATNSQKMDAFPNFNRWSWSDSFPGTVLCVADPTLAINSSLLVGWYIGTASINVSEELIVLVARVAHALGIRHSNVIFYGSSGGGFAAMMLAPRFGGGATAIAINPQTLITRYIKHHVETFLAACFPGSNLKESETLLFERLSAIHVWTNAIALSSRLLILQNTHDVHHYQNHFCPMLDSLGIAENCSSEDGRIRTQTFEDVRGHSGADSKEKLPEILTMASELKY